MRSPLTIVPLRLAQVLDTRVLTRHYDSSVMG
jgi:hypothetical protein